MNPLRFFICAAALLLSPLAFAVEPMTDDPYLWLEDVTGARALDWARARNAESAKALETRPDYAATYARLLAIYNSRDRVPYVRRHGDWFYNLWQDEKNKRGLLRRARLADYRKAEVPWETVLDLDALGAAEKENWSWKGMQCLGPENRLCLVSLARGGADATVVREFDTVAKAFVEGSRAFVLPEAKSEVVWLDADTVYVDTDFGPGSMTDSGYPRIVKRWRRGTPLAEATVVFEATTKDVGVAVGVDRTPGFARTVIERYVDTRRSKRYLVRGSEVVAIDLADDAKLGFVRDTMLIEPRSNWKIGDRTYVAGSLLATDAEAYLAGKREMTVLFTPTPTRSLQSWIQTRDHIVLDILDNVASRLEEWKKTGGTFVRREVKAPFPGTIGITPLYDAEIDGVPAEKGKAAVPATSDGSLAERYWLTYVDFLTADSLALASAGSDARETLKRRPALFDATGMRVEQFFAKSKDGTPVPYFVVWPKGMSAANPGDGNTPTLLYGYGGFEVSEVPFYSGAFGSEWYAQGGIFVLANIRGGGEFGPGWHQAAIKANKQKSYDDFIAVAENLIARKFTTPKHLGIEGGSNGGLLVGAVMLQRPELFNAVVCQAPLLDMKRYSKLLAGASWMGEYGDPDVAADWAVISRYSPYQNLKAGRKYPSVLFTTSTRDDRVHPGHARKMAAAMLARGDDVLYYENIEGGHAGAVDNEQRAYVGALTFTYLRRQLAQ
ncbi:MAG: prolyl oligopeptidase family serine peptidase [Burkholderiales bacterium]|nr:prolyl oligopeptidase family serine peptidase [Burkholderiales bacterium]